MNLREILFNKKNDLILYHKVCTIIFIVSLEVLVFQFSHYFDTVTVTISSVQFLSGEFNDVLARKPRIRIRRCLIVRQTGLSRFKNAREVKYSFRILLIQIWRSKNTGTKRGLDFEPNMSHIYSIFIQ